MMVVAKQVRRSFRTGGTVIEVLRGVDLEVAPGQLVMLKGRSGSGKTTLMNLLGGLDDPSAGEVLIGGKPYGSMNEQQRTEVRGRRLGFVFQSAALLPMLSAYENVELSLRLAGKPIAGWKERTAECLAQVGLEKRMTHRPFELSGGEQQRVAIAKAIAHRPELLLADEPTAELDSRMSSRMALLFKQLAREEGMAICMTTHDQTIMEVADRVYEMADGTMAAHAAPAALEASGTGDDAARMPAG
jgi:putative ABC transport system ATP-binding protein